METTGKEITKEITRIVEHSYQVRDFSEKICYEVNELKERLFGDAEKGIGENMKPEGEINATHNNLGIIENNLRLIMDFIRKL